MKKSWILEGLVVLLGLMWGTRRLMPHRPGDSDETSGTQVNGSNAPAAEEAGHPTNPSSPEAQQTQALARRAERAEPNQAWVARALAQQGVFDAWDRLPSSSQESMRPFPTDRLDLEAVSVRRGDGNRPGYGGLGEVDHRPATAAHRSDAEAVEQVGFGLSVNRINPLSMIF